MASVLRCGVTLSDLALNYFGPGTLRPSASAFSQAKRKTPLYIAENLFHKTNKLYKMNLTYKGYRVILVDGSNEPIVIRHFISFKFWEKHQNILLWASYPCENYFGVFPLFILHTLFESGYLEFPKFLPLETRVDLRYLFD